MWNECTTPKEEAMELNTIIAYMVSFIGFLGLVRSIIPTQLYEMLESIIAGVFQHFCQLYAYSHVPQFLNDGTANEVYQHVHIYLSGIIMSTPPCSITLCRPKNATMTQYCIANKEMVIDHFQGAEMIWECKIIEGVKMYNLPQPIFNSSSRESVTPSAYSYTLKMQKHNRQRFLKPYLEYIEKQAKDMQLRNKEKILYGNSNYHQRGDNFCSVPLKHPATFDTIAMDPLLKRQIIEDIDEFKKAEHFYKRVGRSWKRGYLLYGPPGTGKSSLIGAIANYTGYDVYNLELSQVVDNAELRRILINTNNRSIIVVEDIDCSLEDPNRNRANEDMVQSQIIYASYPYKQDKITLSGLLNFVDGLWSSCGSERIFIFTTNYVDKIDPALLRSGRMDLHIHMSYCTFETFKLLAKNYLQVEDDPTFQEIQDLLVKVEITPADVTELLIQKKNDPHMALVAMAHVLKSKAE